MKRILEFLEKKIQTIVESSVHLLPGRKKDSLTFSVISQIQENLSTAINNGNPLPNVYSIRVSADDFNRLNQENDWISQLKNSLLTTSQENNQQFSGPLSIELIPDEQIKNQNFEISSYVVPSIIEQTSAYKTPLQEIPFNEAFSNKAFLILPNQKIYPLERGMIQIGRRKDNNLVIDHPAISREHAQIRYIHGKYVVFDLNSTSGTYVNDIKVNQMSLYPGDVINLAGYTIIYGEEGTGPINNHGKTSELPRTVDPS
ncbi:MAG: FhaA domain-containing protein [Anaerolineaceae bacterium]